MAQYDVDLRDYWRIIKKRKSIIILMLILVGACSYGFAKLKEPIPLYQAGSAIKIEQSTNLASLMTGGFWYPTENMATHAYIITSFPVQALTVKQLGWVSADMSIEDFRLNRAAIAAIEKLRSMVVAEHQQGTNIIDVQVTSRNPKEAALVANAVVEAYRIYNIQEKNSKTIETKKFIKNQLNVTSKNLKKAEQELQAFKEGYGLIAIDEQTSNNLHRLYSVQEEYEKVNEQRKTVAHKLRMLNKIRSGFSQDFEKSMFTVPKSSPIFDLRNKLSELFLERQTLLIHLTTKHPQVVEIDDQIQVVVMETRKELGAQLRTLKNREVALLKKLKQLRKENQSLPEKALHLVRLEREADIQETLYSQLKAKYQETLIQESGKIEEVSIMRPAVVPGQPFNVPSKFMIVVTGIVMGLILGIVLAFGAELFDTSMGTIEDVEESLQIPVLGVIPYLGKEERAQAAKKASAKDRVRDLITHYDPKSLAAEAFRSLRTNLQFMSLEIKGKSFLITSTFVQEGKTLNVINLALSVAQAGEKVLLVEADLRKPVVYKNFGLPREPGLTDYVLGNYDWPEIVNNISDIMLGDFEINDILKTPGLDNLQIITSGTQPPNPSEILSSDRFRRFLKEAVQKYDYVFVDAPPILPVADAAEIAPVVDGVVLVYTVGKIARGVLKRAKSSLDNIDAKVLGVILNNVKPEVGPDYFRYHSQYYYGHENGKQAKVHKGSFRRLSLSSGTGRKFSFIALTVAVALLLLGIFWPELWQSMMSL